MNTTVQIRFKDQFGVPTVIPDCEVSRTFAEISGCKTLTRPVIDAMKKLGIVFNVVQEQRTI